ncbi:hypothetical protein BsWGS_15966 [Bradybaena similaris]
MEFSHFLSHSETKHKQDSYFSDKSSRKDNILRQLPNINTSLPYTRGQNQEYTELDLLSECSTPVSYVPGRFLQLCDIDGEVEEDAKIWPVSKRPVLPDVDATSVVPGSFSHRVNGGYLHSQAVWNAPRQNLASSKLLVTVVVCIIIALTALGGLVALV